MLLYPVKVCFAPWVVDELDADELAALEAQLYRPIRLEDIRPPPESCRACGFALPAEDPPSQPWQAPGVPLTLSLAGGGATVGAVLGRRPCPVCGAR